MILVPAGQPLLVVRIQGFSREISGCNALYRVISIKLFYSHPVTGRTENENQRKTLAFRKRAKTRCFKDISNVFKGYF
jgi:hypothetical protein